MLAAVQIRSIPPAARIMLLMEAAGASLTWQSRRLEPAQLPAIYYAHAAAAATTAAVSAAASAGGRHAATFEL
eukprot:4401604-Pleurochrysis_carterae.AAC.1